MNFFSNHWRKMTLYIYIELGRIDFAEVFTAHSPVFTSRRLYRNYNCAKEKKKTFSVSKSTRFSHGDPPHLRSRCCTNRIFQDLHAKGNFRGEDGEKSVEHEQSFFHTCLRVRKIVNEHVVNLFPPHSGVTLKTSEDLVSVAPRSAEATFPLYPPLVAEYRWIEQRNSPSCCFNSCSSSSSKV